MGRVPAIATLLALCAVATPSVAAVPVDVCVEPSWDAAVAVMRLDERTPGLTLRPVRPRECARATGYRLHFVEHARRVSLVLSTPRDERLMRPIPWVERSEDAIITLARRGRLGATAVLVEGLVVEDRSMNVRPPVRAARAEPPVVDAPPAPPDETRPAPAVEPAPAAAPAAGASAPTSPRRTARRRVPAGTASVRAAAVPRPAPTRRSVVEAAALDALLARPPPPPEPAPIIEPVAVARPAARRPATPGPVARTEQVEVDPTGDVAGPIAWGLGVDIVAAARAPDLTTPEFALRLVLDRMLVRLGAHPPGEWTLEDRRLRQTAVFAALAYTAPFIEGPAIDASFDVGAVGEWLAIRRQGVPGATTRNLWDVGIDGGVTFGLPVADGWALGLRLGGTIVVANELAIPNVTRSATPGLWQLRAGLVAEWRP